MAISGKLRYSSIAVTLAELDWFCQPDWFWFEVWTEASLVQCIQQLVSFFRIDVSGAIVAVLKHAEKHQVEEIVDRFFQD